MIGTRLSGRYEILREIGRGGMGQVYLARDPVLDRDVAIKVLSGSALTAEQRERFLREARVAARMDHPNIVVPHDMGDHEGSLFFVMPYVPGQTLRSLLAARALSLKEIAAIGQQVAEALEYSHSRSVIHRDIKPENVMVMEEGASRALRARITDFGLATASSESRLTQTGVLVGTASYLSPEQVLGELADERSDIYSLGTVLYECICGEPPFIGQVHSVLYRIPLDEPVTLSSRAAGIHPDIERIVMRCLEKDPLNRPQKASVVAEALAAYLQGAATDEVVRGERHAARAPRLIPSLPLIGRASEIALITEKMRDAIAGECQFVLIGGEPGAGKTRLVEEAEKVARARHVRVLRGRFVEQDQAFPYQGFTEAMQEYFRARAASDSQTLDADFSDLTPDLEAYFPALSELLPRRDSGVTSTPERRHVDERTYLFELLARAFARIGGTSPLLLAFEDLHSVGMPADALQYLVRRLGATPLLVIATYRSTQVDRAHPLHRLIQAFGGDRRFLHIELRAMSRDDHRAFLTSLLGSGTPSNDLADGVYRAAEGNPFFTKEVVRALVESGRIRCADRNEWRLTGEADAIALPTTIQQVVERRIERLPEDARAMLAVASVLGKTFEARDLETLASELPRLDDSIDLLIAEGLLTEESSGPAARMSFSSGVVRDVLHAALPRRRRRNLHRLHAEDIERRYTGRHERIYPQLVHHFSHGDVPGKVVTYAIRWAQAAAEMLHGEEAIRAARAALDFIGDDEAGASEAQAHALLAHGYRLCGNIEQALREMTTAAEAWGAAGDKSQMLSCLVAGAEAAWGARRLEEMSRWIDRGAKLAVETGDDRSAARLLTLRANAASLRGDWAGAQAWFQEASRLMPQNDEADAGVAKGGRMIVAFSTALGSVHPAETRLDEEQEVSATLYETLVSSNSEGLLIPALAAHWTCNGATFVFTIREGATLHDGRPLSAELVKQALEHSAKRSATALPPAFRPIRGVSDFVSGAAEEIRGISVRSECEIAIELDELLPIYPALLTDVRTGIACGRDGREAVDVSGTGAFRIASFNPTHTIIERSGDPVGGPGPVLDCVVFRCGMTAKEVAAAFRAGDVDVARDMRAEDLEEILKDRTLRAQLVEAPKKNTWFALFNSVSPRLAGTRIHQALGGVLRVHDLIRRTLGRFGQPAEGLLPPGILGYNPARKRHPISAGEARAMLRRGEDRKPILLRAAVHPLFRDRYARLLGELLEAWKELGVETEIVTSGMPEYLRQEREVEDIDVLFGRHIVEYDDPDNFFYGLFHSRAGLHRSYFSSPDLDGLIERARSISDPRERESLYRTAEDRLLATGLLVPLFHGIEYRVASPRIKRLALSGVPPYMNYSEIGLARTAGDDDRDRGRRGGILHIPMTGEMSDIDPSVGFLVARAEVVPAVFETLTREVEGAQLTPWLAESFKSEDAGLRFRVRLRPGIRFHDGRPLTSRDVRYSFERLIRKASVEAIWPLTPVRGAAELREGGASDLSGFEIHSEREFTIELTEPLCFFPAMCAYPTTSIVPEGTVDVAGTWRDGCVGTGPFRVVRFDPGRLQLEANPSYWRRGFPRADGLVYSFGVSHEGILAGFESGKFSVAWELQPSDVEKLRRDSRFAGGYGETPRLSTYYIAFNCNRGPLRDDALRRSLMQAIDIEQIVSQTVGRLATIAHGLIPPGLSGYEPASATAPIPQPAKSQGAPVELIAMLNSAYLGPYAGLKDEVFEGLGRAGFRVSVSTGKSEYYKNQAEALAGADIVFTRWIADYPDADTFAHSLLSTKDGVVGRLIGCCEIDRLIGEGRREMDPDARHQIYKSIEGILARDARILPLFHENSYCFARPEIGRLTLNYFPPMLPIEKLFVKS